MCESPARSFVCVVGKGAKEGEEEEEHAPSHTLPEAKIHACHAIARCARNGTHKLVVRAVAVRRSVLGTLEVDVDVARA